MNSDFPKPDYRNTERGSKALRAMIEASEKLDAGDKRAMDEAVDKMRGPLFRWEREPGEDDA